MSTRYPRKNGWRLGEICAAVSVVATLLLLPACRRTIEGVKDTRCVGNLMQIGMALQQYEDKHGSLPPAYLADKAGVPLLSWRVLILPHLLRDDLYQQVRLDEPWNSPHNLRLASLMPAVYRCSADTDAKEGETSYVAVTGSETLWPGVACRRRPATAGSLSTTILVIETAGSGISWMEPRDLPFAEAIKGVSGRANSGIVGRHPCFGGDERINGVYSGGNSGAVGYRLAGANSLFADGSVLIVSEAVSPKTMRELLEVEK